MAAQAYRPDIDGLRAVAVVAVILYHLGLGVSGGFVGVDAFLVLSGFLITRIIAADLEAGTFSLATFWERRIRRIWPAFLAVIAATLAAGWFLLVPADFRTLGKDSLWQCLMVANIHFWGEAGYFAPESETRPLLHLWSLSLEEQFYLCFPPILAALWLKGPRTSRRWLWIAFVASLVGSAVLLPRSPAATFYLLPTRAWELLAGSLLALVAPAIRSRGRHDVAGIAGLVLLVVPMLAYGRSTPFPGLAAVPVCAGTSLLLWAGSRADSWTARLLGCAPMREIGRRSYSAYLWHWPLIAFAHSWYGDVLPDRIVVSILAMTAVLSWASFRWIEQPFRTGRTAQDVPVRTFVLAGLASASIIAASVAIIETEGFFGRFPESVRAMMVPQPVDRRWESDEPGVVDGKFLKPIGRPLAEGERPCLLLVGDSHGMAISPAIDEAARQAGVAGLAALRSSGFPGDGIWQPGAASAASLRDGHAAWMNAVNESIDSLRPRTVWIVARWSAYLSDVPDVGSTAMIAPDGESPATVAGAEAAGRDSLGRLVRRCRDAGATVTILLEVPYQDLSPRQYALRAARSDDPQPPLGVDRRTHEGRQVAVRRLMQEIDHDGTRFFDLAGPLFGGEVRSAVGGADGLWYSDPNHLSTRGAREALGETWRELLSTRILPCGTESTPPAP